MSQQIQIPKTTFMLIKCLLDELQDDPEGFTIPILIEAVRGAINDKYEAIERRDLFTKYKTSEPTSAERESYRNDYLNMVGIHRDWRTNKEQKTL